MKNIRTLFSAGILFLLSLNSCDVHPWGCIEGNDRIAIEDRNVGAFTNVASYGSYVVNVEEGSEYSLTIEADENLLSWIRTSVQGNTLILETRSGKCIRSNEPIIIDVVTRRIDELKLAGSGVINAHNFDAEELHLELTGSGDINCRRISTDYLRAKISGSGNIEISGTSLTADYTITGSGLIRGIDLETNRCYAEITGSGNIYTWVNELLDVVISGSGDVYYQGDPAINQRITGTGNIRRYLK